MRVRTALQVESLPLHCSLSSFCAVRLGSNLRNGFVRSTCVVLSVTFFKQCHPLLPFEISGSLTAVLLCFLMLCQTCCTKLSIDVQHVYHKYRPHVLCIFVNRKIDLADLAAHAYHVEVAPYSSKCQRQKHRRARGLKEKSQSFLPPRNDCAIDLIRAFKL